MKIKKRISNLFGLFVALLCYIGFSNAEVIGISQSEWNSKPDSYWFGQSCDEVVWNEVYSGDYQIYLDNFTNPSSNPGPLYIWNYKILTRGNYLLYNNSNGGSAGNGLVIFNRDYLQSINWKVNPGQTVRHLTTAEEVNGATFQYNWSFNTPYQASLDGKLFHVPNFRSNGTHPTTPTAIGDGYGDAEFRTITLYDSDNNLNTTSNNRAIVECRRNVIRWCGDGIKGNGEQCDPADPTHAGWGNGGCSNSCQPINQQQPQCNSQYNGQTQYTNYSTNWLNNTMNLCSIGTISNFTFSWTTGHARHFNWNCVIGGNTVPCVAYQNWCGNGRIDTGSNEICDEGLLNGQPGHCNLSCTGIVPPTEYCGDGMLQGNEQCDPGSGNFGNGCNEDCQLMTPTCTLTVNPNAGNIPLTTTINGTKPSWATYINLTFGDGQNQSNPTFALNHTYNTVGTFNLTLTVKNNYNGQINGTKPTATCSATVTTSNVPQPYCGDGMLQGNEQCDPGSGNFGNGCNEDCQLETPTCTLTVNPNAGNIPLTTTINGTKPSWATYINLTFGDGQNQSNPIFALNHTYNTVGTFNLTLTVKNNYNGQINATHIPTATCSANVTASQSGSPEPYFLKEQKTGGMSDFTTSDLTVNGGDIIRYKLNFGNMGTVAATGKVRDKLPDCVEYVSSSIVGVSSYDVFGPQLIGGRWLIMYKNIPLNAGQTGYVLIKATINTNGQCAHTTSYLNTGYFTLSGTTLSGDVLAIRPIPYVKKWQKIGNDMNPNNNGWTTDTLTVDLGQFISYRVDFGNLGSQAATGEVRDILPECVQYVNATLVGASGNGPTHDQSTNIVQFTNIPLAAGQTAHMMVLGQIKQEDGCQNVFSYLNTGEFHFIDTPWQNSTVLAERPITLVTIEKEVDKTTVRSGDIVTYTITYTNHGPETLTSYTIVDNWPSTKIRYLTGSSARAWDSFVDGGNTLTRYYNNQSFASGDVRTIIVTGEVL